MKNEIVTAQQICDAFDLGVFKEIETIAEGVLNLNYKLYTDQGTYFVKSVRSKGQDSILSISKIEQFMKEKGIPAISMLQSKDDTPFINIEDQIFTVYSFVESDRSHIYSNDDYFRIGQMLARIHLISKDSIQIDFELKTVKNNDIFKTKEILKSYKERIESKEMKEGTDVLFLEYINLKLKILETMKDSVEIYNHPEHILHGDYHAGNLLIEKDSRKIIGICDWEKTEKGSRAYEIARSAILLFENFQSEMANVKEFIRGYVSIYPISNSEIIEGFTFRAKALTKSKWIENLYYNENDSRANKFIQTDINRLNFFIPLIINEDHPYILSDLFKY